MHTNIGFSEWFFHTNIKEWIFMGSHEVNEQINAYWDFFILLLIIYFSVVLLFVFLLMTYKARKQDKATYKISEGISACIYMHVSIQKSTKSQLGVKNKKRRQVETALFCSLLLLIFPHGWCVNTLWKVWRISDYWLGSRSKTRTPVQLICDINACIGLGLVWF